MSIPGTRDFHHGLLGQPAAEALSLGWHESQSRLWENQVGRSCAFWKWAGAVARGIFGDVVDGVIDEDFYRAVNMAISEFPKGRKYLISLSFRGKASVRPAQVGGFDVNIVIHGSTAVRGRGDLVAYRWALWKLTAPWTHRTRPPHLGKRCAFSTSSTGPFPSNHSRKTPKGPKIALGNPDRPVNIVRPNLIRVESDMATYNLHIMLRFDLERRSGGGRPSRCVERQNQERPRPRRTRRRAGLPAGRSLVDGIGRLLPDLHARQPVLGTAVGRPRCRDSRCGSADAARRVRGAARLAARQCPRPRSPLSGPRARQARHRPSSRFDIAPALPRRQASPSLQPLTPSITGVDNRHAQTSSDHVAVVRPDGPAGRCSGARDRSVARPCGSAASSRPRRLRLG